MDADERLQQIEKDIREAMERMERELLSFRALGRAVEILTERARHVAYEALSEIRHMQRERSDDS